MPFDQHHYVPCLRWKQGEYQAVNELDMAVRRGFTPLIEVPEIGYDFEKQKEIKTLDEHVAPFAKRVRTKWGTERCFVDPRCLPEQGVLGDGRLAFTSIFESMRNEGCAAVPVIGPKVGSRIVRSTIQILREDQRGLCLRMGIETAARPDVAAVIAGLLSKLNISAEECDFILDLGSPNFEPIASFTKLIANVVRELPLLGEWRTFTLLATSFPASLGGIARGVTLVQRQEWILHRRLVEDLARDGTRTPTFGDYGICNPILLNVDMRFVKPSASIRYAISDAWLIVKGLNVRDHKFAQFRGHSQAIVDSPHFAGIDFSWGDWYLVECARGRGSTGNLTTWRKVGTNHHIVKIISDISNCPAS